MRRTRDFAALALILVTVLAGLPGRVALAEGGYSVRCMVPGGAICFVPASPLGAPCWCPDNVQGVIVP